MLVGGVSEDIASIFVFIYFLFVFRSVKFLFLCNFMDVASSLHRVFLVWTDFIRGKVETFSNLQSLTVWLEAKTGRQSVHIVYLSVYFCVE